MINEVNMDLWEQTIARVTKCCQQEFKNDTGPNMLGPALFCMGAGLLLIAGNSPEKIQMVLTKYIETINKKLEKAAN